MNVELMPGTMMRAMTLADLSDVVALEKSVGAIAGQALCPQSLFEKRLGDPSYLSIVVEQSRSIIGFLVLRMKGQTCDWIKLVLNSRGQALMPRGFAATLNMLRQRGMTTVVGRCSERLLPHYERLGMKRTGVLPHYFGVGVHGYSLILVL